MSTKQINTEDDYAEMLREMGVPVQKLSPMLYERLSKQRSGFFEELDGVESSFRLASVRTLDSRATPTTPASLPETPKLPVFSFVGRLAQKARGARSRVFTSFVKSKRDEAESLMISGVVRDYKYGDEAIPLEKQGDLSHYDEATMAKRLKIEGAPQFQKPCKTLWALVSHDGIQLRKGAYKEMIGRFNRVVHADPGNAERAAEADWSSDAGAKQFLLYEQFVHSMWELCDIWTETAEVPEYVALIERLILATTLSRFDGTLYWRDKERVTFDEYFARHWLTRKDNRMATRIQAQYRRRNISILLTANKTNGIVGKIYAKQIHMLAANARSMTKAGDQALRFDAFCLRYFKGMSGSTERALAYLKIFLNSVDALLKEKDQEGLPLSPRVAVFAAMVGIGDTFNGRLFHEYVLKVLAALYTEREANELLAGVDGDAAPVPAAKMRAALWQAMPPALRQSDAVKARISQAVDRALVAPRFKRLVDPDLAMYTALDLFKAADLWHALRRKRAALVIQAYGRVYARRRREKRAAEERLSSFGARLIKDAPAKPPGRVLAPIKAPNAPSPISRKPRVKSPSGSIASFCGITISPRKKLDEALWMDLELNGGTDSLMFNSKLPKSKRPAVLFSALDVQ
ncbi:PAP fibrillin [Aureococcus anophagefferens]|nr:PAP fibrillin [Aureococcus anophagefferens]